LSSTRGDGGLLGVVALLIVTLSSVVAPSAAQAQSSPGHFHGGQVAIGEGAIVVDLDDCSSSFEIEIDDDTGEGHFECLEIEASGPLGDAEVQLYCLAVWDAWPVTATSTLAVNCSMHMTIVDQPFPPPTDALCWLNGAWAFPGEVGNDEVGGSWHLEEASEGFDAVGWTPSCPLPLPAAIDFFVGSGVEALLLFDFTEVVPDVGHLVDGELDTSVLAGSLPCRDQEGNPVEVLFEVFDGDGEGISEEFHCQNMEAFWPYGEMLWDVLCDATWDEWPVVDQDTHLYLSCHMSMLVFDQPFPPPTDALCLVQFDHLLSGLWGNGASGGTWYSLDASDLFDGVTSTQTCPTPLPAAINYFIGGGILLAWEFSFTPA
jgi:hypothetical protein